MPGPGVRMPTAASSEPALRKTIRQRLAKTRNKTLALLEALTQEQMHGQPEQTMGVLAWDVGHIGLFEHRWLVDELGAEPVDEDLAELFDPFEHPRSTRSELELPDEERLRSFLANVRDRSLDVLSKVDLAGDATLTRDGFVHDMTVRHEDQHRETMLATLQLFGGQDTEPSGSTDEEETATQPFSPPSREPTPSPVTEVRGMVEVPAARVQMGTQQQVGTYDNEWSPHEVELDAFAIDRAPVTNGAFIEFIEDGGYEDASHWSEDGWMIRQALDLEHPKFWTKIDGRWHRRSYDRTEPVPEREPVVHVSFYEAQAYAAWADKRLPTEAEWETAACWDPDEETRNRFPWGDQPWDPSKANLGQRSFAPAEIGAYPEGASPVGCHQMVGDIWEWTVSTFAGYPGFEAFPYPEYSAEHFEAGFHVLRGGSWATMPSCAHVTFRNWHQGDHQQIFAGFRCARDLG